MHASITVEMNIAERVGLLTHPAACNCTAQVWVTNMHASCTCNGIKGEYPQV